MQIAPCFKNSEGSSIRVSFPHTTNNVTRKFLDLIVPTTDALKLTAKASQLTFMHKSQSITPVTAIFLPSIVYTLTHITCFLLSLNQAMSSFPAPTVQTGSRPKEAIDPPTDPLHCEVTYRVFILSSVIKRQSQLHL